MVLSLSFKEVALKASNPYEKENTVQSVFDVISTYPLDELKRKSFYNL